MCALQYYKQVDFSLRNCHLACLANVTGLDVDRVAVGARLQGEGDHSLIMYTVLRRMPQGGTA